MADRGRQALPSTNRLTSERWNHYCMTLHHDRLTNMTATPTRCRTMDNTLPHTMKLTHLKNDAKKKSMEIVRLMEIQRENQVLLEKMSKIMKHDPILSSSSNGGKNSMPFQHRSLLQLKPGTRIDMNQYPAIDCRNHHVRKSLNRVARIKELQRITQDNFAMLERIQSQRPYYSREKWDDSWEKTQKYADNVRSKEIAHLRQTLDKFSLPDTLQHKSDYQYTRPWTEPDDSVRAYIDQTIQNIEKNSIQTAPSAVHPQYQQPLHQVPDSIMEAEEHEGYENEFEEDVTHDI